MQRPEIHDLRNIRNYVLGGVYQDWYAVNFNSPLSYTIQGLKCQYCKREPSSYKSFQYWESANSSTLFCLNDDCILQAQIWKKSHPIEKKLVLKVIKED